MQRLWRLLPLLLFDLRWTMMSPLISPTLYLLPLMLWISHWSCNKKAYFVESFPKWGEKERCHALTIWRLLILLAAGVLIVTIAMTEVLTAAVVSLNDLRQWKNSMHSLLYLRRMNIVVEASVAQILHCQPFSQTLSNECVLCGSVPAR